MVVAHVVAAEAVVGGAEEAAFVELQDDVDAGGVGDEGDFELADAAAVAG